MKSNAGKTRVSLEELKKMKGRSNIAKLLKAQVTEKQNPETTRPN